MSSPKLPPEFCERCGRETGKSFMAPSEDQCYRWYAYRDQDAEDDCTKHAARLARVVADLERRVAEAEAVIWAAEYVVERYERYRDKDGMLRFEFVAPLATALATWRAGRKGTL